MCGLVEGIRDIGRSIDDGIHNVGRGIDRTVRGVVPGGWGTLAAGAGMYFGLPPGTFGAGAAAGGASAFPGAGYLGGLGETFTGTGANSGLSGLFGGGASSGLGSLFGGLSSSQVGGVGDLLRGGFGVYQANQLRQAAQPSAVNQSAQAQLEALMANPSGVTNLPGYGAGLEAVQRGMAAGGYRGSGNMAAALQKYGGDFYNNAINQYSNLSQLGRGNDAQYNMGSMQLAGQAMNSLGYGGLRLFGK